MLLIRAWHYQKLITHPSTWNSASGPAWPRTPMKVNCRNDEYSFNKYRVSKALRHQKLCCCKLVMSLSLLRVPRASMCPQDWAQISIWLEIISSVYLIYLFFKETGRRFSYGRISRSRAQYTGCPQNFFFLLNWILTTLSLTKSICY